MTATERAKEYVKKMIEKHPELKDQIMDFYELFLDEVSEGSSAANEYNLMVGDIEDLIEQ